MTGTSIQPITWAITQSTGSLESARIKFSLPREMSIVIYTTLTLSLGLGINDTSMLPITIATPAAEVTSPNTAEPPLGLGITYPGSVASNADATKLTPDIKRISVIIIGVFLRNIRPSFASLSVLSLFSFCEAGIRMNPANATKASTKLIRSTAMTTSRPANAYNAEAISGFSTEIRDLDRFCSPLIF